MYTKHQMRLRLLRTIAALVLLAPSAGLAVADARQPASAAPAQAPDPNRPETCGKVFPFDPSNFPDAVKIDNRWFPLTPGTQFVLEGGANRGSGERPHRVVFTVTDLTKFFHGVRTIVVWDRDYSEGRLNEAELAFFAQDKDGNVWSLGEYPEEYENGRFQGAASTWIAGRARAKAGIMMMADPRLGTPRYLQGWMRLIEFLDCAQVAKVGKQTCVPAGCYDSVLVADETSPLDPESGHQIKYYAPGVGNVQIGAVGDKEDEVLVLTKLTHLGPEALAEARMKSLKMDKRAFLVSRWYRLTMPAEPMTTTVAAPAPAAASPAPAAALPAFSTPTTISNRYFPLSTISQTVALGALGGDRVRVTATLLPDAEPVTWAGGTTEARVVQYDTYVDGVLSTSSDRYFAQADSGDVYLFGADVANYSAGKLADTTGSWLAGEGGAAPVLLVPAAPQVGKIFNQASAPTVIHGTDEVLSLTAPLTTTASGPRADGLLIRETAIDGSFEYRVYLPGLGLVEERLEDGTLSLASLRRADAAP